MSAVLSPIVSEFETQEAADAYDVWFRAKVQKSIDSKEPHIPHDKVKAEIHAMLEERRKKKA
ncbi:MAG: antitoxin [Methylotenera sp.]|nr:antitoxin [Methylotenera sp.]NOT65867.1 antitoxin [Methylotenera sp.]